MIAGINESKTLTKHISFECKYKFDGGKYNSNQSWNNDKCWCECEKHRIYEKDHIWNPAACSCKNGKDLLSIIDDTWVYNLIFVPQIPRLLLQNATSSSKTDPLNGS